MNPLDGGAFSLLGGVLLGAVGSIPLAGPISVMVFRRGLAGRTAEGRAVATGAALAEGIQVYLALRGLNWIAARWPQVFTVSQAVAAAVLILAGVWLWVRPIPTPVAPVGQPDQAEVGELGRMLTRGRRGAPAHLVLGFGLTGANLSILLNWTAILGVLSRFGWQPIVGVDAILFAFGVVVGVVVWFEVALRVVGRFRTRLPDTALRWTTRAVGVLLVGLGGAGAVALAR